MTRTPAQDVRATVSDAQVYFEDVAVGDALPAMSATFTPRRLVQFAGAALDFYEIHYDRDVAAEQGLDGIIVHGALKNALLGRFVHEWVAPAGRLVTYGCQYRGMDAPGEELVCRGTVTGTREDGGEGVIELEVGIERADGTLTTPGHARVVLPHRDA